VDEWRLIEQEIASFGRRAGGATRPCSRRSGGPSGLSREELALFEAVDGKRTVREAGRRFEYELVRRLQDFCTACCARPLFAQAREREATRAASAWCFAADAEALRGGRAGRARGRAGGPGITRVPTAPAEIVGLIGLRGTVIPLVDPSGSRQLRCTPRSFVATEGGEIAARGRRRARVERDDRRRARARPGGRVPTRLARACGHSPAHVRSRAARPCPRPWAMRTFTLLRRGLRTPRRRS